MSRKIVILFLCFLSFLPLIDLFHSGLPVTHDGQDHIARIANFYQSLHEGNLVPRWAANLNWGYGHPILMFLYPLPSYFASAFHFLGFSFVDSVKLVFGISFIASVLAMFLWVSEESGTIGGFIGALLYGFAPYRFVDLYVRGAIGEHIAFFFPPLVLFGLLQLSRNRHKWMGLSVALGTAGLILAHNAISLMFLPIIFAYTLYLYFFDAKKNNFFLIQSFLFISLGFVLSAFFWIPALFEGKYTLRDIVTKGNFADRFTDFGWFLNSLWNYGGGTQFSKSLGIAQWAVILSSLVVFLRSSSKKVRILIFGSFVMLLSSIFVMTSWSAIIWEKISFIQKFQFPWRLLTLCVFAAAPLGGIVTSYIPKKFYTAVFVFFVLTLAMYTFPMWKAKEYSIKTETFYSGIYDGTTDTGESSPIWSVRFMEKRPNEAIEVISGQAQIRQISRSTTRHSYSVESQKTSRILENTLYFPGWTVTIDGKQSQIEFQDPMYRGLITFLIDSGQHTVIVQFKETRLRTLADTVSIIGFGLVMYSVMITIWRRR